MSFMLTFGICIFGGLGAALRYIFDSTVRAVWQSPRHAFPLSTLVINVLAGFFAGIVAALAIQSSLELSWKLLLATGFLGGFSTFSTAINEILTLAQSKEYHSAALTLLLSLVAPLVAVACGFIIV